MLALFLMFALTVMDIMMVRQRGFRSPEAEYVPVPGTSVTLHPYHMWVMTFFWMAVQFAVAGSYWFYARDAKGSLVLFACGAIFSMFAVQDALFFQYQGRNLPDEWTWLYWQNDVFGSPLSGTFVLAMASFGLLLIFGLYYLRLTRFGRHKR